MKSVRRQIERDMCNTTDRAIISVASSDVTTKVHGLRFEIFFMYLDARMKIEDRFEEGYI